MAPKVLIVDDEEPVRLLHGRFLKRLGCWCVLAADAEQARHRLTEHEFALALVDVNMPGTSGLELVRHMCSHHRDVAILMVTAVDDPLIADSALEFGAYGYLVKPFECNELLINVSNALRRRKLELQNRQHRDRLEELALGGESTFHEAMERLKDSDDSIGTEEEQAVLAVARLAEFRSREPGQHIERMSSYCWLIAKRFGYEAAACDRIRIASMLHDVGKIAIPEGILFKTGRVTPNELEVIRRHAQFGHHMLMGCKSEMLKVAAAIAWTHHERYDGTGYPEGLAGDAIPAEGRIAAIADVFDSLTSKTVYKPGYSLEKAVDIMVDSRGKHFDPTLLDLFVESLQNSNAAPMSELTAGPHTNLAPKGLFDHLNGLRREDSVEA